MRKILIANRGEIARRIIRTAHAMGIETVAVYSDADAQAPHVREATQAIHIGPAAATESYLRTDKIIDAVRRTGADAIHPGYGFLSENADFAEACARDGVTFIGPPPSAIRAMGLKDAAKRTVKAAGVHVVPGYQGDDQSLDRLSRAAAAIGYPVLIKAVAGGGGKGMRRVDTPEQFADNLMAAQREALKAFGNDWVLIEKYLVKPRHVEIQVFGDSHGSVVHLFERDCSLQRRHQKVVEEAPSPGLPADMRAAMGEAAVKAAQAIHYTGAGTVEFIVDVADGIAGADGKGAPFFFMEMNTRLQVEHPVTEMITGLDLVEWQIRVARGERLPLAQEHITMRGHAVEVRLYAEDADNGFLPSVGVLDRLRFPPPKLGVRIDSGVEEGGEVTVHYDPMIAKLIAYGPDRNSAIAKLQGALDQTIVSGPKTNRAFLARLIGHEAFRLGDVDTGFIERHQADLKPSADVPDRVLALAALALVTERPEDEVARLAAQSPWTALGPWRLNLPTRRRLEFVTNGGPMRVLEATRLADGWQIDGLAKPMSGIGRWRDALTFEADYDGDLVRAVVLIGRDCVEMRIWGKTLLIGLGEARAAQTEVHARDGKVKSPMPGKILSTHVKVGQYVEVGERLLVLEAMKMEHRLAAPVAGTIAALHALEGAQVSDAALLVEITIDDQAG
jgi:3-methylcrotonyl-CoA carboxylase alpha subunit